MIPAVISSTVLARLHPRAAAELYLTGSIFDGTRAAEVGLVTAAVPAEELDETVHDLRRRTGTGGSGGAGRHQAPAPSTESRHVP